MSTESRMDSLWTVRRFAAWKYGVDEPTDSQTNTVRWMCTNGKLPSVRIGKEWRIDVRRILEGVTGGN